MKTIKKKAFMERRDQSVSRRGETCFCTCTGMNEYMKEHIFGIFILVINVFYILMMYVSFGGMWKAFSLV